MAQIPEKKRLLSDLFYQATSSRVGFQSDQVRPSQTKNCLGGNRKDRKDHNRMGFLPAKGAKGREMGKAREDSRPTN